MEQILLAYGLPKETVTAILMLNKIMKVKVCSPDGDTDSFDIVACVLEGDTLAPYLFIICLDCLLWMLIDLMKENGFILKMTRSRWYSAKTIIDADYTDDIVLLTNTPTQAKSQLHSLEQAVGSTVFFMNADKMEYMYFNQKGDISTLNGDPLKLVDKFTYLRSSISCTENDFNMWQAKVIDHIEVRLIR